MQRILVALQMGNAHTQIARAHMDRVRAGHGSPPSCYSCHALTGHNLGSYYQIGPSQHYTELAIVDSSRHFTHHQTVYKLDLS